MRRACKFQYSNVHSSDEKDLLNARHCENETESWRCN